MLWGGFGSLASFSEQWSVAHPSPNWLKILWVDYELWTSARISNTNPDKNHTFSRYVSAIFIYVAPNNQTFCWISEALLWVATLFIDTSRSIDNFDGRAWSQISPSNWPKRVQLLTIALKNQWNAMLGYRYVPKTTVLLTVMRRTRLIL